MPCIRIGNAILTVAPERVSLKTYGSNVWMEYHHFLGPTFFRSPRSETELVAGRKIWDAFYKWQEEHDPRPA